MRLFLFLFFNIFRRTKAKQPIDNYQISFPNEIVEIKAGVNNIKAEIEKAEFYADGTLIGTHDSFPHQFNWQPSATSATKLIKVVFNSISLVFTNAYLYKINTCLIILIINHEFRFEQSTFVNQLVIRVVYNNFFFPPGNPDKVTLSLQGEGYIINSLQHLYGIVAIPNAVGQFKNAINQSAHVHSSKH